MSKQTITRLYWNVYNNTSKEIVVNKNGENGMKVRIKMIDTMSKAERKELDRYSFERAKEMYDRDMLGFAGRCYKLFVTVLHIKYGFGKKRIIDILDELNSVNMKRQNDQIFWKHIDDVIVDELKIDLPRENYEDLED